MAFTMDALPQLGGESCCMHVVPNDSSSKNDRSAAANQIRLLAEVLFHYL